ncbi:hypothetical protein FA95DRAFT_1599759 [Auriscalpium vulgare]|uniref:Uncharacterized protein n=1 Tax=Auriscalpium vulgare TaxID=40419 RepID=A0ACB8R673_9AGAM|nr:hypothetical protein FA95DRAFT_1599759 [Auriscalpium vulgare]
MSPLSVIDLLPFAMTVVSILLCVAGVLRLRPSVRVDKTAEFLLETSKLVELLEKSPGGMPPHSFVLRLDSVKIRFNVLRSKSKRAPGLYRQARAAIGDALTWKLFRIHWEIEGLRRDVLFVLNDMASDGLGDVGGSDAQSGEGIR